MATKKTAKPTKKPAAKSSGSKTAKTTKPTKPVVAKPKTTRAATTKPTSTKKRSTASKPNGMGRMIAIIVGIVAVVALIIIGIVALVNGINQNGKNNMTVETGTGEKVETQYLGFDDFKFRLKVPKAFHALTDAEIQQKYNNNVPEVVYADNDNTVNIAISPTDDTLNDDQVETYLKTMENILSMSGNKILSSKLTTQGNHNIGTIQFVTDSTEGKYYNYMAFFSQDDKLSIITFNVKDTERETWQPVADFVIKSLDFVK